MELHVSYVDEVYCRINCDRAIAMELSDRFSFMVPNARFMPSYRNKVWDGKIRLFNVRNQQIYSGLRSQIEKYCNENDYTYTEDSEFASDSFSIKEAQEFIQTLSLPEGMVPYEYQVEAFAKAIRDRRRLFLSPTSSGKSLIIYLITKYLKKRTLIIVPKVSLVNQLASDFCEYDASIEPHIHKIFAGEDKNSDKGIYITTWQSIYKLPKAWFSKFGLLIGDEAHTFTADCLTGIMTKTTGIKYKNGFTGTLDGSLTNKMVLEGLFGPIHQTTTNAEMMEKKRSADLYIKCIVLDYPEETRKSLKGMSYQEEITYIINNEKRSRFIANLAHSLNGNVLVLFRRIEHGESILHLIKQKEKDRSGIYYVDGGVDKDVREDIRQIVDTQTNSIIVASLGTFSTGINIKNLNYIILATPAKSRITLLQSVGRGLRISKTKSEAVWYDIADDISWKKSHNYTLKHYAERIKIYNDEKFSFKQYRVKI